MALVSGDAPASEPGDPLFPPSVYTPEGLRTVLGVFGPCHDQDPAGAWCEAPLAQRFEDLHPLLRLREVVDLVSFQGD